MTSLFTTLEFRRHLKRFQKAGAVAVIQVVNCEPVFVKVDKVGLFTVTLNVVDIDEETWLGTEIIAIKDITAINESCVQRVRTRLLFQDAGPGNEHIVRESLMNNSLVEEGEDYEC